MLSMFVTELVSQLLMSTLKFFFFRNKFDISVTPVVHEVASCGQLPSLETKLCSVGRSTLVYVTPLMPNVSPTATPGHMTVTPFGAR